MPERLAIDGGTPVRTTPLLPGWPGGLLIGEEGVLVFILIAQHLRELEEVLRRPFVPNRNDDRGDKTARTGLQLRGNLVQ